MKKDTKTFIAGWFSGFIGALIGVLVWSSLSCAPKYGGGDIPMNLGSRADTVSRAISRVDARTASPDSLSVIQVLAMFSSFAGDAGFYDIQHGEIQKIENTFAIMDTIRVRLTRAGITWPPSRITAYATWGAENEARARMVLLLFEPAAVDTLSPIPVGIGAWSVKDSTLVVR
jgi:hypothetical protein